MPQFQVKLEDRVLLRKVIPVMVLLPDHFLLRGICKWTNPGLEGQEGGK